jgi:CBS domain-containing protein
MKLAKYITRTFLTVDENLNVKQALKKLANEGEFDCIVVKGNNEYVGMLSLIDLLTRKVSEDSPVSKYAFKAQTLEGASSIYDAIEIMHSEKITKVPVLDHKKVFAVVPHAAVLRTLISDGTFDNVYVSNVMIKNAPTFYLSEKLKIALELAKNVRTFSYPVVDIHGVLYGAVKIYDLLKFSLNPDDTTTVSEAVSMEYSAVSDTTALKVLIEKMINKLEDIIIVNKSNAPLGIINFVDLIGKVVGAQSSRGIKIIFSGDKDYQIMLYVISEINRRENYLTEVGKIREIKINIKKVHGDRYEVSLNAIGENNFNVEESGFRKDLILNEIFDKLDIAIQRAKNKQVK